MARKLFDWFDARLKLKSLGHTLLDEPIPGGASWIYVFGSATLFLFCLQATTGMFLALYYVPSPDAALRQIFVEPLALSCVAPTCVQPEAVCEAGTPSGSCQ